MVTIFSTFPQPPPASVAGARASSDFFDRFNDPNTDLFTSIFYLKRSNASSRNGWMSEPSTTTIPSTPQPTKSAWFGSLPAVVLQVFLACSGAPLTTNFEPLLSRTRTLRCIRGQAEATLYFTSLIAVSQLMSSCSAPTGTSCVLTTARKAGSTATNGADPAA